MNPFKTRDFCTLVYIIGEIKGSYILAGFWMNILEKKIGLFQLLGVEVTREGKSSC